MKERQKAEKEAEKEEEDVDDIKENFNEEEVNRMKELAKRLSQQIMAGKSKSSSDPENKGKKATKENGHSNNNHNESKEQKNVINESQTMSQCDMEGFVDDEQPSTSKAVDFFYHSCDENSQGFLDEALNSSKQIDTSEMKKSTDKFHKHKHHSHGHKQRRSHGNGKHKHSSHSDHKHRHSSSGEKGEYSRDRHRKDKKRRRKDASMYFVTVQYNLKLTREMVMQTVVNLACYSDC